MLLKRIAAYIKNHDWFAVIVEIFVIFLGLMLALQLDRWREEHQEQELELVYIERLIEDIATKVNIIGFDVVELCPNKENKAPDYLAAKLIYRILNIIFKRKCY